MIEMDYERGRMWSKVIVILAVVTMLASVPIVAARQTTYEMRRVFDSGGNFLYDTRVPVDSPSPIAGAGYYVVFFGLVLGIAGFTAYIYFDLKMKTAPHSRY